MKKNKQKIYRQYEDFYTKEDLKDPDIIAHVNLIIEEFNAQGHIVKPRAPCVVTTIDPLYKEYAGLQRISRKFRMKTDILRLREITRKKFMIYATQQRHLEKQREIDHNEKIYKGLMDSYEFMEKSLNQIESNAFNDMIKVQKHLDSLKEVKLAEELKQTTEEHQRVLMEVGEIYAKFKYFIKLISYFDEDALETEIDNGNKESVSLTPAKITDLQITDKSDVGQQEAAELKVYMEQVVRPYLAKRKHLHADTWIRGFENIRLKISHYNSRFTRLALLNHIVTIVHDKFENSYTEEIAKPIYLKDPKVVEARVATLKQRTKEVLADYERKHKKDKINIKLNAIMPIVLGKVESLLSKQNGKEEQEKAKKHVKKKKNKVDIVMNDKSDSADELVQKSEQGDTLTKVEMLQEHLLYLLGQLDKMSPELYKGVEKRVRRNMHIAKEMARRALLKQNRLKCWMAHFKKHEMQKRKTRHNPKDENE